MIARTLALLALLGTSTAFADELGAAEFKAVIEKTPGIVLDVRTPPEVARGKLTGASVIDWNGGKFEQRVALLAKDKPVYVYCASGNRSGQAMAAMQKLGFKKVVNLAGGMRAWTAAGLPVEVPAGTVSSGEGMSPEAFDALLKKEPRMLVDFQTPWCTPCQKMAPVVDGLASSLKGVKVLKVDLDASEALAAREKIEGVPVFVLYVAGKEKARLAGEQTRAALEALVRK